MRSATVTVNGAVVLAPGDLAPVETIIEDVPVIHGQNELVVDLRGAPGSFVTISMTQEVEVCPPGVEMCQVVTPEPVTQFVAAGSPVSIVLDYASSHAEVSGLGVNVYFDSTQLQFVDAVDLAPPIFVGLGAVTPDTLDGDDDPITDQRFFIGWVDVDPPFWPGTNFQTLIRLNFTTTPGFSGATEIGFTLGGGPPNFLFFSRTAEIAASP